MGDRIIKALSGFYYVQTADGVVECRARGKMRREKVSPLVGDFVEISRQGAKGTVEQSCRGGTSSSARRWRTSMCWSCWRRARSR
ncbi:MAG: hypothetical protein V8T01_06590 [Oscillospiraceae bacterium]